MNSWYSTHAAVLQQTGTFFVLALSIQVVLRSGLLSFASIGLFGVGGYLSANLAKHHFPLTVNIVVVVISGWLLGWLIAVGLVRLRGLYLGMATFALNGLVQIVALNLGSISGGAQGLYAIPVELTTFTIGIIAAIVLIIVSVLEKWSVGRCVSVLAVDERLGRSLGLEVEKQRRFVMAISGALGALAGSMNTLTTTTISPSSFNFDVTVLVLTIAVLGGIASWRGALIGTVIIVWFPQVASGLARDQTIVYAVVVLLVLIFSPGGIYGIWRALRRRWLTRLRSHREAIARPPDKQPIEETALEIKIGARDGRSV